MAEPKPNDSKSNRNCQRFPSSCVVSFFLYLSLLYWIYVVYLCCGYPGLWLRSMLRSKIHQTTTPTIAATTFQTKHCNNINRFSTIAMTAKATPTRTQRRQEYWSAIPLKVTAVGSVWTGFFLTSVFRLSDELRERICLVAEQRQHKQRKQH